MSEPTAALKLTPDERDKVRERYAELTESGKKHGALTLLAREYGVHIETIRNIVRKKTKTDSGEPFKPRTSIPDFVSDTSADFELRKPRILLFDIETSPNLGYVWQHYEANVLAYESQWHMLAFAAKWLGDAEPVCRVLPDYDGYDPANPCDKAMVAELWKLFDEADVLIGHNGDKFDIRMSHVRMIVHGLRPPQPSKTIDTLKVAKRYFRFNSNKLDDLGDTLGVGRKVSHTGFKLWMDCMKGDRDAWELMRRYNEQDVLLLERVYEKLKTWMVNHPNMAILSQIVNGCAVCASTRLERKGFTITGTGSRYRYQCLDCGAWGVGRHRKTTDIR